MNGLKEFVGNGKWIPQFLGRMTIYGIILTFVSGLYYSTLRFEYPHDFVPPPMLQPAVIGRRIPQWAFPLRQTNYGFPSTWLKYDYGVLLPGGGDFSRYELVIQGLVLDALLYTSIVLAIALAGYMISSHIHQANRDH